MKERIYGLVSTKNFGMSTVLILLAGIIILCGEVSFAGTWFSGTSIGDGQTIPFSAEESVFIQKSLKQAEKTFIDLTMTLTEKSGDSKYPSGDYDGNTQAASPSQQDRYEEVIQYMADAIYEMTNGKHLVRNVRIFTKGANKKNADILWKVADTKDSPAAKGDWFRASPHGAGVENTCIYMYDFAWHTDNSSGSSYLPGQERELGYTLAHELGHYLYGVFDEYKNPDENNDIPVDKSVMNNQWNAAKLTLSNRFDWLNFSIPYQAPTNGIYGPWVNTKQTNQQREHNESVWETLSREPRSQIEAKKFSPGDWRGSRQRKYFSDLADAAPTGTNTPSIELSSDGSGRTGSRAQLNITWMNQDQVFFIIIDRSGSMEGEKLSNAKTAAKLLVDLSEVGKSTIGVISFSDTVHVDVPLTLIENDTDKATVKTSIDGISAWGSTAVGEAAYSALQNLLNMGTTDDIKVVFLLTDGLSNSGRDPRSVIPAYQTAQIPLFTFSYGSDADFVLMSDMATQTGGETFKSPTDLAAVSKAFQRAFQYAAGAEGVASGSMTASANSLIPTNPAIYVDSTIGKLFLSVITDGGSQDSMVELYSPSGTLVEASSISQGYLQTLYFFEVAMPEIGDWVLRVTPVNGDINFTYQASAIHDGIPITFEACTSEVNTTFYYPEPIVLLATLGRELPISGAKVEGIVLTPNGYTFVLPFFDDGQAPDEEANDGNYSALLPYTESGSYDIQVNAYDFDGQASLTSHGLITAPYIDGTDVPEADPVPLGKFFERTTTIQLDVEGVSEDDHGNNPMDATLVNADNEGIDGRIDYAGDVDFFVYEVPEDETTVIARLQVLGDLTPIFSIYDKDGTTVIGGGNTEELILSVNGYYYVTIDIEEGREYFLSVEDADSSAYGGQYVINVSPIAPYDVPKPLLDDSCGGCEEIDLKNATDRQEAACNSLLIVLGMLAVLVRFKRK